MSIMVKYGNNPTSPLYESGKQYVKINGVWKSISSAYIKVNGAWRNVPLAASRGYERITSSKYWSCPAGVTKVDVFLVGGGHNGNGAYVQSIPYGTIVTEGQGGAGGSTYTVLNIPVIPGTNYYITVGSSGGVSAAFGYNSNSGSSIEGGKATMVYRVGLGQTPGISTTITNSTAGNNGVFPFGDSSFSSMRYGASGASGGIYNCLNKGSIVTYGNYGGNYGGGNSNGGKGADGYGAGGGGGAITTNGTNNVSTPYGTPPGTGGSGCVYIRWGY